MTATLQEQLNLISKEIFINNININNNTNSNKHMNIIGEIKNDRPVHSDINYKDVTIDQNSMKNINLNDIEWGEILYVDLKKGGTSSIGSEQGGTYRYAICIQNILGNKYSPTIIVLFLTSQMTKSKLPTHVNIKAGNFGLPKDSVVLAEQVRTLDKSRIIKRVGKVDDLTALKIEKAMQISTARKLERKTDLEKLPNEIKNTIKDKLKSIHIYEEAIIRRKTESLVKHLLDEREIYLMELEEFCKENNLDYRDYYKMCQIGDKSMVI